jgi:radical SAM-linked protein
VSEVKPANTVRQMPSAAHQEGLAGSAATRLRITFAKTASMRYTSHLDLHRTWERTVRRAKLPLAYSQGYNRRPRLQLAMALPLGYTSECELLDAWFETALELPAARSALERAAPPGLQVLSVDEVDLREPPLQTRVWSAVYSVTLLDPVPDLGSRLAALLGAQSLPRERRGKAYDLRPLVEALSQMTPDEDGRACLHMQLAAREGHTGRPDEVLLALGISAENARVRRAQLILERPASQDSLPSRAQE